MRNKGQWKNVLWNLVAAVAVASVLVFVTFLSLNLYTRHGEELLVPDLSNLSVEQAAEVAASHKMTVEVSDSIYVKRMAKGAVFRQIPTPGSKVKRGRCISLIVNTSKSKQIAMPDLVGLSMRQAKAEILSRGLSLGRLIYVRDMATNNVLKQLHDNAEIEPETLVESESVIDLVLGMNADNNITYVPDVVGLKYRSAVEGVHDNSLNVRGLRFDDTVRDFDDSLNARVYRQTPAACDSIGVVMGTEVLLHLTLDENRMPVNTETVGDGGIQ